MSGNTRRFTVTDAFYVDVSEGATSIYFILGFNRQRYNAIRLAIGQTAPNAETGDYQDIDPGRFQVGSDDYSQEVPVRMDLDEGDRVFVRAERDSCEVVVHRRGLPLVIPAP